MNNPNIIIDIAKQAFKEGLRFRLRKKFLVEFCQQITDTYTLTLSGPIAGPALEPNDSAGPTQVIWVISQDKLDENMWLLTPQTVLETITIEEAHDKPLPALALDDATTKLINDWVRSKPTSSLVTKIARGTLMYAVLYALGLTDANKHRYLVSHETNWPEFKTYLAVKVLSESSADIEGIPQFFTIVKGVQDSEYIQHGLAYDAKLDKARLLANLKPFNGRFWTFDQPVMEGVRVEDKQ